MKLKLFYETLKGEKKHIVTSMKNVMGGTTYFDFVSTFKRCDDKIKENFTVVIYDNEGKIIHKENIHIQWVTYPNEDRWSYGITICGDRIVSEVVYGKALPVCSREEGHRFYVDVQVYENGVPLYDEDGYPVTHKEYCPAIGKIKECSTEDFPKSVLQKLIKYYSI